MFQEVNLVGTKNGYMYAICVCFLYIVAVHDHTF